MVTNIGAEQVKRILIDIFQALIEVSRRTNKEARLRFKNLGCLSLYQNRELSFQQSAESGSESL